MSQFDHTKYRAYRPITLPDRRWPDRTIERAPDWCAVDLRDGNQALVQPMSVPKKLEMFALLVEIGFKEIEIGFPSASQTEFDFARRLIEKNLIPDDVTVQVLTQARRELIDRTFEALRGVKRAIVHVYNSTSPVQREQVFKASSEEIVAIAVNGARQLKEVRRASSRHGVDVRILARELLGHRARLRGRGLQRGDRRLAAAARPEGRNQSAGDGRDDDAERVRRPDRVLLPAHRAARARSREPAHAQRSRLRGGGRASSGCWRAPTAIEGTLFGNGERTGNMDIVTMAMNLYSQGVDPKLDFADMGRIIEVYRRCTDMPVHPRHPWAGDLVYAAFSGSHQDAIRKSLAFHREHELPHWAVAYLPIDPRDLGRRYEEVVRINSQSGKGGVALVLERDHGITLPKWLHPADEQGRAAQADATGEEISSRQITALFEKQFSAIPEGWRLLGYDLHSEAQRTHGKFRLSKAGAELVLNGDGQGLIEAIVDAVSRRFGVAVCGRRVRRACDVARYRSEGARVRDRRGRRPAGDSVLHRRRHVVRVAAGHVVRDRPSDRGADDAQAV